MASITIYICPVGSGDHDLYFLIKLLCLSFIESCVVTVKGFQLFKSYQSSVCTMDRLKKHLLKFKLQMFHKNCDGWRYAKVGVMYANMWVTQMSE